MRILIIHSYYARFGGGEVFVRSFIDLLKSHGDEVFLFSFTEGPEIANTNELVLKDVFYEADQNPLVYFGRYLLRFFFDPCVILKLRRWIRKIKPDVIHIHANDRFGISVLIALIGVGIPVVQSVHAYTLVCMSKTSKLPTGHACWNSSGIHCLVRKCLPTWECIAIVPSYAIKWWITKRVVDRIIAANPQVQKRLACCGFSKTVIIEHFVKNPKRASSVDKVEWGSILCVGRLSKEKGFQFAILAMEKIRQAVPGAVLHICGEGPYEADLILLVNQLNLNDTVLFHGYVDPVTLKQYYQRANLVVFPSLCLEICGLVNLEALSAGRPLIISDACGIRELFQGKEIGFFVDPADILTLSESIQKILRDPGLFLEMSNTAYKLYLEKFNPEIHYQKILSLYRSLLTSLQ